MDYLSEDVPLTCLFIISTDAKCKLRFELEAIYAGPNALKNCKNSIAAKLKLDVVNYDEHDRISVYDVTCANNEKLDGFVICIDESDDYQNSTVSFPFPDMTYNTKFTHIGSRNDLTQGYNIGKNRFVGFLIEKCIPIYDVYMGDGF